jgi:hypothetical protein
LPPSSPGRPIITNSPERNRKLSGRVMAKLNSRSVQCFTQSTVSSKKGLAFTGAAGASAVVITCLFPEDPSGRRLLHVMRRSMMST